MQTIEIVKLSPEYIKLLERFFKAINTPEYISDFSPHPFNAEQASFICNYKGHDLYYSILWNKEEIIGYGMLRGWDEGFEIPSIGLCILKKYQGLGLGKLLLNFLEVVSRLNGCNKVMLKVKKNNKIAIGLYEVQNYVFREHDDQFMTGYKQFCSPHKA